MTTQLDLDDLTADQPLAQAELLALRKDAERYRWLRQCKGLTLQSSISAWTRHDGTEFTTTHYLASGKTQYAPASGLDATVDGAMQVSK